MSRKKKCVCRDCGLLVVVEINEHGLHSLDLLSYGWHYTDSGQWVCPDCWHHRVHHEHMVRSMDHPSLFVKEAESLLREMEDLFYDSTE